MLIAYRLLRHALELKKPVLMLNIGPTRADPLPGLEKIEMSSRIVMRDAVRAVLSVPVTLYRLSLAQSYHILFSEVLVSMTIQS